MAICHIFVTAAIQTINKTDYRITMNPYLRGEKNIRFWSKCMSWLHVWWNMDKIEQYFLTKDNMNPAWCLWCRYTKQCKFLMVQWITVMEVCLII